jgi:hypothetical protein
VLFRSIDGFVDKNDKKSGPYGAFIPQEKNFGRKLKTESKRFTENSEKIINFINKYKKKTAR